MARSIVKELITFCEAQATAGISTVSDYGMRIFLDKFIFPMLLLRFEKSYLVATFLGAITGGIVNCCLNYRFVFDSGSRKKKSIALRYLLIWSGSVVLNTAGTAFFKETCGIKAYYAMLLTSALVAICWNYLFQRTFVFKAPNPNTSSMRRHNRKNPRIKKII